MFGFCTQDVIALIVLITMSTMLIVQKKRHKTRVKEIRESKSMKK